MTEVEPIGNSVLPVRLSTARRAEVSLLADFDKTSQSDLARKAVELELDRRRANGDLAKAAEAALAEVDRDAERRRAALTGLLGGDEPAPDGPPVAAAPTKAPGRTPKP